VVFGFGFRSLPYRDAFLMMGSIVMASSLTTFFFKIPCHSGLIRGSDNHEVIHARERHLLRLQNEAERAEEPSQQTDPQAGAGAEAAEPTQDSEAAGLDVEDPPFAEDTHTAAD
jgi:hypothetical protein